MRRVMKKGIAIALAAAMVITAAPASQAGAAKKPALNIKKKTVKPGATVKLKIKNGSKKAKVTWKASKKKMVKLSKKSNKGVTVKALKKTGKVNVTASYKVGKKKAVKLTCKLTIKKGSSKVTNEPVVTPAPATQNPVVTPAPATQSPNVGGPTPTKGPTKTPAPTKTPGPAAKNGAVDARKLASGAVITVDGTVGAKEWMDANVTIDLLQNANSVRGEVAIKAATAKLMWADDAVYALIQADAAMEEVTLFVDDDGDATNNNAKKATGTLSADKMTAEVKVDCAPNADKGVKAEIMVKAGGTINYFDSVTKMAYNAEKDEWALEDEGIKAGTDDSVLGTVNLLGSLEQPKTAYFTKDGADIIAEAAIPDEWETPAEDGAEEGTFFAKTKKMNFVDVAYWTDVYAANSAESIMFQKVNTAPYNPAGYEGTLDGIELATAYDADGNKLEDLSDTSKIAEWRSDRSQAQGYVMWDKQYAYVLFDITDSDIAPVPVDGEERYVSDSTEFFFNEDNATAYGAAGDSSAVQFRVSAIDNGFSSNEYSTGKYELVAHAVGYKYADGVVKNVIEEGCLGYYTQYIIKLGKEHRNGDVMGMDLQVNDCSSKVVAATEETPESTTPVRNCTITAYDTTNSSWENPTVFGRIELVNPDEAPVDPNATPVPTEVPAFDIADASDATPAAMKVDAPIVADGTIDEAWADVPAYAVKSTSDDSQALVKTAWDADNLYVLVRVKDAAFDSTADADYMRDGGELFLDEDNSKEDSYAANTDAFQYRYSGFDAEATTTKKITEGSDDAKAAYAGIEAAHVMVSDGYIVEYKVPWADKDSIAAGKVIGYEVNVFDCAGGSRAQEMLLLTEGGALYQNPSLFGEIELTEKKYDLHAGIVEKPNSWDPAAATVVKNADGSVTITKTGEFGFVRPNEDWGPCSKIVISYKDSDNAAGFGYVVKYDSNNVGWANGEENKSNFSTMTGEGTAEIIPANPSGNVSGIRIFGGTDGATLTITDITFVK
ncbi:MAG: hypothetical protein E7265_07630 [Lachnospiraceae bacterium]|nr:hypothetical protein [Lachnospiraceae bacterium]